MSLRKTIVYTLAVVCIIALANTAMAKERKGEVTFQFNLHAPADANEVRLWLPYPMSDKNQDITSVVIKGNYSNVGVYREPKNGSTALYAEWKSPQKERLLTYTIKVTRKEVITKDFPQKEQPLSKDEFQQYLDNSHLGATEKRVKEIAADITKGKKTILD